MSGNPLGDADDRLDAPVRRLVDRVGGERRGHEHHCRVRAGFGHRLVDGVEHGHAVHVPAALARRDAGHQVGPVLAVPEAVERPLAPGQALDEELRVLVDENRH